MVLGRVPSNFVQPRVREENTSGLKSPKASSSTSTTAVSRRRRARHSTAIPDRQRHAVRTAFKRASTRTPPVAASRSERHINDHEPQNTPSLSSGESSTLLTPPPSYSNLYGDVEMLDATQVVHDNNGLQLRTIRWSIPRTLIRPPYKEIPRTVLESLDPDLGDVSIDYIRELLLAEARRLFPGLAHTTFPPNQSFMAPTVDAIVPTTQVDIPSHVLMIREERPPNYKPPAGKKQSITVFPVHHLVLATHCANLPTFSQTPAQWSEENDDDATHVKVTLPVQRIAVPYPRAFPPLAAYLYTKNSDFLLSQLLPNIPLPPPAYRPKADADELSLSAIDELATLTLHAEALRLSRTHGLDDLRQRLQFMHGFYMNVVHLGVFDDNLWITMDVAWEVLVAALTAANARNTNSPPSFDAHVDGPMRTRL